MKSKDLKSNISNGLGIISLGIPIFIIILILNWFFQITPYQRLEGIPLLITPFLCPIGIILGIISMKVTPNKCIKLGIIINAILLFAPSAYWCLGILFFGV